MAQEIADIDEIRKTIGRLTTPMKGLKDDLKSLGESFSKSLDPLRKLGQLVRGSFVGELTRAGSEIAKTVFSISGFASELKGAGTNAAKAVFSINGISNSMGEVKGTFDKALAPINNAVGAIGKLGGALGEFVSKSNPASMLRFDIAMQDTMAVIGQSLAPAMDSLTGLLRAFGDEIASNNGGIDKLADGMTAVFEAVSPVIPVVVELANMMAEAFGNIMTELAPGLAALAEAVGTIFDALQPVIGLVADLAGTLAGVFAEVLKMLADVVETVVGVIWDAIEALDELNPFTDDMKTWAEHQAEREAEKAARGKKSSMGASVRESGFAGIEDIGRKAIQASSMAGAGPSKEERQLATLEEINRAIEKSIKELQEINRKSGDKDYKTPSELANLGVVQGILNANKV